MKRQRVALCFLPNGRSYKAHDYGQKAARRPGERVVCRRCGDHFREHKNALNAKHMRERRKRLMALGRCYQCGQSPLKSIDLCARCHEMRLVRQRRQRAEAKAARLCYVCGLRCDAGHSMCTTCRKDRRALNQQLPRAGICRNCRKPSDRDLRVYCSRCAHTINARQRKAYHEGRICTKNPRGKQKPLTPKRVPAATPIAAKVFMPAPGSIAGMFRQ